MAIAAAGTRPHDTLLFITSSEGSRLPGWCVPPQLSFIIRGRPAHQDRFRVAQFQRGAFS